MNLGKFCLISTLTLSACAALAQDVPAPATSNSCLIVKHKGTIGRRLMFTALIGVPIAPGSKYDLVDTVNYQNAKATYKGKDLNAIQASGTRIIILENKYKSDDLQQARKSCSEPQTASRNGSAGGSH